MDRKLMTILMLLLMINLLAIDKSTAQTTFVYIDPQLTETRIGKTFTINVSISQVTDLAAWEFKLYYESSILNATNITEGPFLKSMGNTTFIPFNFTDSYNATHGRIWFACTLTGQGPGASGNGTLATITFKAKGPGVANLHLADTDLLDSKMPPNRIGHTTIDGIVQTAGHDIALIRVTPLKNIVGQGYTCRINVTAENQGAFTETFNVTLYADAVTIATIENIVLARATCTNITFTWNTTGFAKSSYTIKAYASPVPSETDTGDNTATDGLVLVTIPGDATGDGVVDAKDLRALMQAWPPAPYIANCDFNDDDTIDGKDLRTLGLNWGAS